METQNTCSDELSIVENMINLQKNTIKLENPNVKSIFDDPFIHIEKNNIDKNLCSKIINYIHNDNRIDRYDNQIGYKERVLVGGQKDLNSIVVSRYLYSILEISRFKDTFFKEVENILFFKLRNSLKTYFEKLSVFNIKYNDFIFDSGFRIQIYKKGTGKISWHNDSGLITSYSSRKISFIWYLNDIEDGGETTFLNGKITPETGTLLLFPSTWTYVHRGEIPISSDKYIIIGWLFTLNNE
jgi:hypothetical protein